MPRDVRQTSAFGNWAQGIRKPLAVPLNFGILQLQEVKYKLTHKQTVN